MNQSNDYKLARKNKLKLRQEFAVAVEERTAKRPRKAPIKWRSKAKPKPRVKVIVDEALLAECIEEMEAHFTKDRPADITITKEQMKMAAEKVKLVRGSGADYKNHKGEDSEIDKCRALAGLSPLKKKKLKCLQCGVLFLTTAAVRICGNHQESKMAFLAKNWSHTP